jgi:hypothetical protein
VLAALVERAGETQRSHVSSDAPATSAIGVTEMRLLMIGMPNSSSS